MRFQVTLRTVSPCVSHTTHSTNTLLDNVSLSFKTITPSEAATPIDILLLYIYKSSSVDLCVFSSRNRVVASHHHLPERICATIVFIQQSFDCRLGLSLERLCTCGPYTDIVIHIECHKLEELLGYRRYKPQKQSKNYYKPTQKTIYIISLLYCFSNIYNAHSSCVSYKLCSL